MNLNNFSFAGTKEQQINSQKIKILIVDDQKVVRAKLQEILSTQDRLEIVGMYDDQTLTISKIESLQPDVVLIDVEMPKIGGLELTKIISQKFPKTKILVISTHKEKQYAQQSMLAGAGGFISKETSAKSLIDAIYTVYQGFSLFKITTIRKVQENLTRARQTSKSIDLQQKFPPKTVNPQDDCQITHQPTVLNSEPQEDLSSKNKLTNSAIAADANPKPIFPKVKAEKFFPFIGKWPTWFTFIVIPVISLGLPATSLLKYKTKVKITATVRPVGEARIVQSATEGKIVEVLVKQNQAVKPGDIIAQVDSSPWQTKKNQLEKAIAQQRLQLTQLNSQIATIESQIRVAAEGNNSQILAARAELTGNQRNYDEKRMAVNTKVREAQAQVRISQARLNAAKSKLTRYRFMGNYGALSQEQLAETKLEVYQQQQALASANAQLKYALVVLNTFPSQVEMAQQRIHQVEKSGQASIAQLNQEKEELIQQRIGVNRQLEQDQEKLHQVNIDLNNTKITATEVGVISNLQVHNPGQTVQPGQEIAQIIPSTAPLEMKAVVSPQEINKLEVGQKVQMQISACPYPDYGILEGTVGKIANDTSKPEKNSFSGSSQAQKSAPAFYEVSITPQATFLGLGKKTCSLQSGMKATADILIKEETVMGFLLRKASLN